MFYLVVPKSYTASKRALDIYIYTFLSTVSSKWFPWLKNRVPFDRISGYSIYLMRHDWPHIARPGRILLNIESIVLDRMMGSHWYEQWVNGIIKVLKQDSVLHESSRHIYLRGFTKAFRPEQTVEESFIQFCRFYRIRLCSNGSSLRKILRNLLESRLIGLQVLPSDFIGDVAKESLVEIGISLLEMDDTIVYSFHSSMSHYLERLNPRLCFVSYQASRLHLDDTASVCLIDEADISVLAFDYPKETTKSALSYGLYDDDDDDDDDENNIDNRLSPIEAHLQEASNRKPNPFQDRYACSVVFKQLLKKCRDARAHFTYSEYDSSNMSIGFTNSLDLGSEPNRLLEKYMLVFFPKPAGDTDGLLVNRWICNDGFGLVRIQIDAQDLRNACYTHKVYSGWGLLCLCRLTEHASVHDAYKYGLLSSGLVSISDVIPEYLLGRIDNYELRPL